MQIVKKKDELSKVCEEILDVDGEGMLITDQLLSTLKEEDGIGLAANQIGINKRACVLLTPEKDEDTGEVNWFVRRFVNPEILEFKDPFIFLNEGCLSFPGQSTKTLRYGEIFVKDSLNPEGVRLYNLEAVVAYHEIDHLNGITMFERKLKSISGNDKCHCNSGLKYKRCCMLIAKERDLWK